VTRWRWWVVRAHDEAGVVTYLAIAFGLAWLPFVAQTAGLGAVGPALMPIAPAVACVVVRRWVTHEGFGDAGLRPRLRHWPTYLVALAWPIGAAICTTVVTRALRLAPPGFTSPWGVSGPSWSSLTAWIGLSLLIAPVILGEELGWRGYLQLRLFPDRPLAAALATGFIWGIWHYPLILAGGEPTNSTTLTLVVFPVATMTFSVFLGWVRAVTGTVWATSVAHASNNVTNDSLQRLSFTGREGATLPDQAVIPCLLGEAIVWGAIIGVHALLRPGSAGLRGEHVQTAAGSRGKPQP
jgi:CAAX protease family protein